MVFDPRLMQQLLGNAGGGHTVPIPPTPEPRYPSAGGGYLVPIPTPTPTPIPWDKLLQLNGP